MVDAVRLLNSNQSEESRKPLDKTKENIEEPRKLFSKTSELILSARSYAARAVNSAMVMLYWQIGRTIQENEIAADRAVYGKEIVKRLAEELQVKFGKGYSYANITRMVNFYNNFTDSQIVATLSQQLSWSHIVEIIKLKDTLKRDFYITMCLNEGWSVRELSGRIDSMLFERTAISKRPEETIINDLQMLRDSREMSVDLFLRDPYMLDFLGLKNYYGEKDMEAAIVAELQTFILEMGSDFAFLARQKRIIIDGEDHYIDLLFYHRKLRRLVVIELKLGKFRHEHKSQLELYLRWLDKHERQSGEHPPLGLLLCAEKSEEVIELLELGKSGIHVATYLTELPPMEVLKAKLHESVEIARKQLNSQAEAGGEV